MEGLCDDIWFLVFYKCTIADYRAASLTCKSWHLMLRKPKLMNLFRWKYPCVMNHELQCVKLSQTNEFDIFSASNNKCQDLQFVNTSDKITDLEIVLSKAQQLPCLRKLSLHIFYSTKQHYFKPVIFFSHLTELDITVFRKPINTRYTVFMLDGAGNFPNLKKLTIINYLADFISFPPTMVEFVYRYTFMIYSWKSACTDKLPITLSKVIIVTKEIVFDCNFKHLVNLKHLELMSSGYPLDFYSRLPENINYLHITSTEAMQIGLRKFHDIPASVVQFFLISRAWDYGEMDTGFCLPPNVTHFTFSCARWRRLRQRRDNNDYYFKIPRSVTHCTIDLSGVYEPVAFEDTQQLVHVKIPQPIVHF